MIGESRVPAGGGNFDVTLCLQIEMLRWRDEGEERKGERTGKAKYARAGRRDIPLFRAYHRRGKKSPIVSNIWHSMAARFRWAKESFRGSKCSAVKRDLSYVFMIYLLGGFLEITRRMLAAVKDVEVDFLPLLFIGLNTLCTITSIEAAITNFKDARSWLVSSFPEYRLTYQPNLQFGRFRSPKC